MRYISIWIRRNYQSEMENFRKMKISEKVRYFFFVFKNKKTSDLYEAIYTEIKCEIISFICLLILLTIGVPCLIYLNIMPLL